MPTSQATDLNVYARSAKRRHRCPLLFNRAWTAGSWKQTAVTQKPPRIHRRIRMRRKFILDIFYLRVCVRVSSYWCSIGQLSWFVEARAAGSRDRKCGREGGKEGKDERLSSGKRQRPRTLRRMGWTAERAPRGNRWFAATLTQPQPSGTRDECLNELYLAYAWIGLHQSLLPLLSVLYFFFQGRKRGEGEE